MYQKVTVPKIRTVNMNKNTLLKSFIIFLILISCSFGNSETQFIYENGNQKVAIKILNGNDYLEYDKPIPTDFVLTNIDPKKFMVVGAGIRLLEIKNGVMKTEIKVPSNYLKEDTLNVRVRFGNKPEENHEFNIPIKRT